MKREKMTRNVTLALFMIVLFSVAAFGADAEDTLSAGCRLDPGQKLVSANGALTLSMNGDGNLVLYAYGNVPRWQTQTDNHDGAFAVMQEDDGNLVVYDVDNTPLWDAFSHGGSRGGNRFKLQDDGNLVIYAPGGKATWNSGTFYYPEYISAGKSLGPGSALQSRNGEYELHMQGIDGNLVFYKGSQWMWETVTGGNPGSRLDVQTDGNLVIYTAAGPSIWQSETKASNPKRLNVQDDGKVVLYSTDGRPIWDSSTATNLNKWSTTPPDVAAAVAWCQQKVGTVGYAGMCLKFSRTAYNIGGEYSDAKAAWANAQRKHPTSSTDGMPVGAFLFMSHPKSVHGHVGIYAGNGHFYTTNSSTKRIHLDPVNKWQTRYGYTLLGWSEDLNGVTVEGLRVGN